MKIVSPNKAAIIAFLLTLPIGLICVSIVFEIQWIETVLKSVLTSNGDQPNLFGHVVLFAGLLALPIGLVISLWPLFRKGVDGTRHFYILNVLVALAIIACMIPTWGELAEEIYRCDILNIPNCD